MDLDLNSFFRRNVTADLTANHDRIKVDIAAHNRLIVKMERSLRVNFTFQVTGKSQFAIELKIAFDFDIGVEDISVTGIRDWVHG